MKKHAEAFDTSTPHLYISALPWLSVCGLRHYTKHFQNIIIPHDRLYEQSYNKGYELISCNGGVASVSLSRDGRYIAVGLYNGDIKIWNFSTRTIIGEPLIGHKEQVLSVAFSSDGKYIVSGSFDRTVRIWDVQSRKSVGEPLTGHEQSVTSVAFSPDGKYIVSGSKDRTIRLWNIENIQVVKELDIAGHNINVSSTSILSTTSKVKAERDTEMLKVFGQFKRFGDGFILNTTIGESCAKPQFMYKDLTDGWVKTADGRLILWIPDYARSLLVDQSTMYIRPRGIVKGAAEVGLDISKFCYGTDWTKVYTPVDD